jgi:purine-cytosine permease-like protein
MLLHVLWVIYLAVGTLVVLLVVFDPRADLLSALFLVLSLMPWILILGWRLLRAHRSIDSGSARLSSSSGRFLAPDKQR